MNIKPMNKQSLLTPIITSTASSSTPISSTDLFLSNPSTGSDINLPITFTSSNLFNHNTILTASTNSSIAKYTSAANCSGQLQTTTTNCIQCWHIENTLLNDVSPKTNIGNDIKKTINSSNSIISTTQQNDQPQTVALNESAWQVDDVQINAPKIHYNNNANFDEKMMKSEIDTTSFIILRDDDIPITNIDLTETTNETPLNKQSNTELTSSSHSKCDDCCYCNPDLHKNSETICNFCKLQKSNRSPSQPTTAKYERETKTTSTNTNNSIPGDGGEQQQNSHRENIYEESVTKKDHTHVRTKSKDSDTVSLKCTKINSKIRRFIPEDSIDLNMFPPSSQQPPPPPPSNNKKSNINNPPPRIQKTQKQQQQQQQDVTDFLKNHTKTPDIFSPKVWQTRNQFDEKYYAGEQNHHKSSTCVRLPSPFTIISSHNYDSSHSSDCSTTSSSNSSKNEQQKNGLLIQGNRWQTNSLYQPKRQQQAKGRSSRYQDFYGSNAAGNENRNFNNNELSTAVNKISVNDESAKSAVIDKSQSK